MTAAVRRDYLLLTSIATAISIGALIFYYHQGAILLYGDAVAHINIARRVFDSRTPSLLGFGTVWLPLPHLLDIPFIVNDRMWQTRPGRLDSFHDCVSGGDAGRVSPGVLARAGSRMAAWIAALIYALNPNLIYMQSTAMGESLYLALFVWAAVYFSEFVRDAGDEPQKAGKSLRKCGLMVSAAMLVRYDGWFLAAVIAVVALAVMFRLRPFAQPLRRGLITFVLLTGLERRRISSVQPACVRQCAGVRQWAVFGAGHPGAEQDPDHAHVSGREFPARRNAAVSEDLPA